MKALSKIILVSVPILSILAFLAINYPKSDIAETYQIGLSGIKKQYTVGEEIKFSIFLTGYGSECGSYEIRLMKEDALIDSKSIDIDCTQTIKQDFESLNFDIASLQWLLLDSGDYTAFGEFSKSTGQNYQEEKRFTVVEN